MDRYRHSQLPRHVVRVYVAWPHAPLAIINGILAYDEPWASALVLRAPITWVIGMFMMMTRSKHHTMTRNDTMTKREAWLIIARKASQAGKPSLIIKEK